MESLFHIKCHRITDNQQVEEAVGTVVCFLKRGCFVVFIGLRELEILMFAINGDQDTLEDNGTYHIK